MIRGILYLFISIFFFVQINSCKPVPPDSESKKTRIILVNPSAWYLESLVYLAKNNIINIPNLEFQAVFYTKVQHRFEESEAYLQNANIIDFILSIAF